MFHPGCELSTYLGKQYLPNGWQLSARVSTVGSGVRKEQQLDSLEGEGCAQNLDAQTMVGEAGTSQGSFHAGGVERSLISSSNPSQINIAGCKWEWERGGPSADTG